MSVQAITWVLEDAPDVPPHLVSTLIALANHAGRDGRGAHPGQSTLARYTRKSDRAIRKDLIQLMKLGLVCEGDQRLVSHYPADRRPVVYDLAVHLRQECPDGTDRNHNSARSTRTTGTTVPVATGTTVPPETGDDRNHSSGRDRNYRVGTTGTGVPTNQVLNQLPLLPQASSAPRTAIASALGVEEEEADRIFNRILVERQPVAPSRYVETLIASGDIAQFRTTVRPAAPYTGARCTYVDPGDNTGLCGTCGMPAAHARHGTPS